MNIQGWDVEGSVDGYLRRVAVWKPREGVRLQGTVRDSGRRAPEMEHLSFPGALMDMEKCRTSRNSLIVVKTLVPACELIFF